MMQIGEISLDRMVRAVEKVRQRLERTTAALISDSEIIDGIRCLSLEPLVHSELHTNRCENLVNVRDIIDANLIDETWPSRFEAPLNRRLQELIGDPDG